MTDVRLQAVDGQDHPPGPGGDPPQPGGIGAGQGREFVVPVQEVADAPHADRHAAANQCGADLRHAAMLGMAEAADQRDDVQAELVLRQDEPAFLLGPEAGLVSGAPGIAAAADLEPQLQGALQRHDRPPCRDGRP
ncbi:MAG: hypothetical protein U0800_09570 [Isosphaeraceae bacterium]